MRLFWLTSQRNGIIHTSSWTSRLYLLTSAGFTSSWHDRDELTIIVCSSWWCPSLFFRSLNTLFGGIWSEPCLWTSKDDLQSEERSYSCSFIGMQRFTQLMQRYNSRYNFITIFLTKWQIINEKLLFYYCLDKILNISLRNWNMSNKTKLKF